MSALEIAQLMGDTRVETIERRYFALDTARLRAGMERAATDPELALIDNAAMGQRMGQGGDTNGHGEPSPDVPGSTAIH